MRFTLLLAGKLLYELFIKETCKEIQGCLLARYRLRLPKEVRRAWTVAVRNTRAQLAYARYHGGRVPPSGWVPRSNPEGRPAL